MKRKPKMPAARNPFVALAAKRKAGVHRKSNKAVRAAQKVEARRGVNSAGQSIRLLSEESPRFESGTPYQFLS